MRITKIWTKTDWKSVWKNIKATPVRKSDLVTWYKVIHDIIPTGTQLNRINITKNDTCTECGRRDIGTSFSRVGRRKTNVAMGV